MKSIFRQIFVVSVLVLMLNIVLAQQPNTSVTLGIKPGYFFSTKGKGVLVDGLIEGRAAEKAGIKEGDIITTLDGKPITTIFIYKEMLDKYKPGDKVKVTVMRGEKEMVLDAVF